VARPTATDRMGRLLALVPWVVDHPGVHVDEVAERFGVKPAELVADLETLSMVGVYPYTPDALVEVTIEDDEVWVRYADWFERPLRLTPGEALALVAAGRGLAGTPGADPDGALARGIAKLEGALRLTSGPQVDVDLGAAAPESEVVPVLRQAVATSTQVELDYWSLSSDEVTTRTVDPYAVAAEGGAWYLRAFDHLRDEERVFRIDRVRAARPSTTSFEAPAGERSVAVYEPRPDDPRVTLELSPAARWVLEAHPHEEADVRPDGSVAVTLAVSSPRWLAGLLLRLGADARVAAGGEALDLEGEVRALADRVVARYHR
jgi:proteasome accessory factor C